MPEEKLIPVSFRCYYPTGDPCDKLQMIYLSQILKWIDSYLFTHPACVSITVKVWALNVSR